MCKMRHQPAILLHDGLSAWHKERITKKEKSGHTYICMSCTSKSTVHIYVYEFMQAVGIIWYFGDSRNSLTI